MDHNIRPYLQSGSHGGTMVRGKDGGLPDADPDRDGAVFGNAAVSFFLCDRDRNGAAGEIYQAVLCAPVRQQCKPADEADPVPDTDT